MIDRDAASVLVAQKILEQDLQGVGQARGIAELGGGAFQREVVVAQIADLELAAGAEAVVTGERHHCLLAKRRRGAHAAGSADRRRLRILRAVSSARVRKICTATK